MNLQQYLTTAWEQFGAILVSYSGKLFLALVIIVLAYIIIKIIDLVIRKVFDKTPFDRSLELFVEKLIVTVLWIVTFVVVLGVLGVNVSAIVASLGIMGFVVGFALKDTLGNLASGVMLLFYKPFKLGDYVQSGGFEGTVKGISVSACTLRTGDNKNIVIPNAVLWGKPLVNFTANKTRRIELILSVSYKDNLDKAMKVVSLVLKKEKRVLLDPPALIAVQTLNASSVDLIIRPWVKTKDFKAVTFSLTKALKEACDKNKIDIPFPQSVVYMKK
jgi:small conductance mechanosensitive channel